MKFSRSIHFGRATARNRSSSNAVGLLRNPKLYRSCAADPITVHSIANYANPTKHLRALDRGFIVIVAIALLFLDAYGGTTKKFKLPAPGRSVRITDQLHGMDDYREFVFQGIRGTRVKIELSGVGPLRGVITFPSGGREGGPGGVILNQPLGETGQYRLKVTESTMSEAWNGAFNIEISVLQ